MLFISPMFIFFYFSFVCLSRFLVFFSEKDKPIKHAPGRNLSNVIEPWRENRIDGFQMTSHVYIAIIGYQKTASVLELKSPQH